MKTFVYKTLAGLCIIALTGSTMPDDRIVETVECHLKEGKTIEDAHAANSKWVVFMNANVEGGDIRSFVLTAHVGEIASGKFMYVDSYPSLESWVAGDKATETEAFKPIGDALRAAAECSKNALYKSKES